MMLAMLVMLDDLRCHELALLSVDVHASRYIRDHPNWARGCVQSSNLKHGCLKLAYALMACVVTLCMQACLGRPANSNGVWRFACSNWSRCLQCSHGTHCQPKGNSLHHVQQDQDHHVGHVLEQCSVLQAAATGCDIDAVTVMVWCI